LKGHRLQYKAGPDSSRWIPEQIDLQHASTATMVSFTAIFTTALALVPGAISAPSGDKSLSTRQWGHWQWWTEGQGQFSCQQQGGGKYSCTWNGQPGGGMVAGTGWDAGRK
jgi:endo-1,4-beta-xylanase